MHDQVKIAGAQCERGIRGESEGRPAQFHRTDTQQQMVHNGVRHHRQFQHIHCSGRDVRRHLLDQLIQCLADDVRHLLLAPRMHHQVGDPAHQVFAKAYLRIHEAAAGEHCTIAQVA